jgi:tetratricopeptide (TPR) repeat protein
VSSPDALTSRVEALGRQSRRAALISGLGFVLVIAAFIYAAGQLRKLETKKHDLESQLETETQQLEQTKRQLVNARKALSSTRAAINAFHEGDFHQAVSLYDEALAWDPGNAYIQNLRAYSLFRLHRVDEAIAGERRSIAADPQYAWGYFDLARFLCAASPPSIEEARSAAAKAIELRPEMRDVMRGDGEFQHICRGQVP